MASRPRTFRFFSFNDTATTEINTLYLHDALPICDGFRKAPYWRITFPERGHEPGQDARLNAEDLRERSEEHTSELQSRLHLVCRLLLEKKNTHPLRHL